MAELLIIAGPGEGQVFEIGPRCVIGRHADCDIQVKDDTISRHHAVVTEEEGQYFIEDLGSSNGTFVNGREVRRAKLEHGDTMKLSHAVLVFRGEPPASHTAVAVVPDETSHSAVVNPVEAVEALMRESTAVENVRELQDIHRKLITMARFSDAIRSSLDLRTLLERVLSLLFETFPQAERGFVMLYDDGGTLRSAASKSALPGDITISKSVLDAVVSRRRAILSNNPLADTRFTGGSIVTTGMRSLMVAPLVYGDDLLGVIHLDTTRRGAPFSADDLSLFGGLAAAAVSAAIANARLHESLLKRQRLEQELTIAQTVQRSFLPSKALQFERVELAYHYALAYQVGGDFYDIQRLADGRIAATIGDVSGKGIPAALLMAKTISEIRSASASQTTPSGMFAMVNRLMTGTVSPDMFVTALSCFYEEDTGRLTMCDAGHMAPIVKRAGGVAAELELGKGFPLGVTDEGMFEDAGLVLAQGDTLLFYTDGVTDAANDHGEAFGAKRLVEAARKAEPGARNVVEGVLAAIGDFVGLTRPFDDLTMIALSPK